MFIKNLSLKNYRNYKDEKINFINGINILTGQNAQGKTNIAESIFYLCTGYSPRATRDKQVITYGESNSTITGKAVSNFGEVEVSVDFFSSKEKEVKVNGVSIKKIGEIMGNINSVFFNPSELKLIKESPEDRRRFMDISISQMNRKYFFALQKYRKILEQRNSLLKSEDYLAINETLQLWDIKLSEYAEIIIKERLEFIKTLTPFAKEIHSFITDNKEELELSLDLSYIDENLTVKESIIKALGERVEKDIALGYTGIGPHRDDIKIKLNDEDVKVYGSQGQQRTCALSLKLAEVEVFKQKFKEYPILILDDALSELDKGRRSKLLERIKNIQVIITCTEIQDDISLLENVKIYKIQNGKVIE